jgi:Protein of unknown function (DUF2384)
MSENASSTYAALRSVLLENGAPPSSLSGLTELAVLLSGRHRLSPSAASRWMTGPNPRLEDQRPLDVWVEGRPGRVLDAVRAEGTRQL